MELPHDESASEDQPVPFRYYQAEALKTWCEDSGYIRRYRGSDKTEHLGRLFERILPMEEQKHLYREEGFQTEEEFRQRLEEVVAAGGIHAGAIALSFSLQSHIPTLLAMRKGRFFICYKVIKHHSAREIYPLVAKVSVNHGPEFEVVFPHGTRFGMTEEIYLKREGSLTMCGITLREMEKESTIPPPPPSLPISEALTALIEQRRQNPEFPVSDSFTNLPLPTIRLQLYDRDREHYCAPEYSVLDTLLFEVTAVVSGEDLTPQERLFIVHAFGRVVHEFWLTDLYMECGCFSEAFKHYLKREHPRKLGDVCWCEGRLDEAEAWYLQTKSVAQSHRKEPDYDRLIKLAYARREWAKVISLFETAPLRKDPSPEEFQIGSNSYRSKTFLLILAGAVMQLGGRTPPAILRLLESTFGLTLREWEAFLSQPSHLSETAIAKLKARCLPLICKTPPLSLAQALEKGDTARAHDVIDFMRSGDQRIQAAQKALEEYGDSGSEQAFEEFFRLASDSGIPALTKSILYAATGSATYPGDDSIPKERRLRLYTCHPFLERKYQQELLALEREG